MALGKPDFLDIRPIIVGVLITQFVADYRPY